MSDNVAELIRQLGGKIDDLGGQFGAFGQRLDRVESRLEQVEREQTRLRVDLMGQAERILNEQSAIRGDMRIVIARVDRLDATVQLSMPELRALHDSFNRMSDRVRKLEDGHS
jgi:DNA anti-recombination protein RmuC